jgi:hypothetical protein
MAYEDDITLFNRWRNPWHWAVNKFNEDKRDDDRSSFMYHAMDIAEESRRLPLLFKAERSDELPKVHVQCACCAPEHQHIAGNHLTCCLGVKCRECPQLLALDHADLTPEQRDQAKAWTCIAHIGQHPEADASEGMILTVDDRMYWDQVYARLAASDETADDAP